MYSSIPFRIHDFFKNKELNRFYISIAIITFGESLISLFIPIYLYQLGYEISTIILFYSLAALNFVIFSYFGAKITARIGFKHSILYSIPFMILYYFGFLFIESYSWLFFIIPTFLGMRSILFNYGYHLNFIVNSEKNKRGREISFIGILTLIMHIIAPFLGGLIAIYSFKLLYLTGSIILFLGAIPLLYTKDIYNHIKFDIKEIGTYIFGENNIRKTLSFVGYSIESSIGAIIWPIYLIIILVSVYNTGVIVTLSAILSIITFYISGTLTDKKNKLKILRISTVFYFLGWMGRILANSATKILIIDSYKNLTEKFIHTSWLSIGYDIADKKDKFIFIVSREITYNLTRTIILPLIALIFIFTSNPFIISFIVAGIFSLGYSLLKNPRKDKRMEKTLSK